MGVELLPDEDEREHLLDQLGRLILAAGGDGFVAAPIVLPDDRAFPDRWAGDAPSVYRLLRRLLSYAGLDELDLRLALDHYSEATIAVDAHGNAQVAGREGVAGWFAGIDHGVCQFGVDLDQLEDPAGLAGTLAHEVAHAWRAWLDVVDRNRDVEERLTDLTTVYLGFGLLTANASQRFVSGARDGLGSFWRSSHGGYLAPQALCFLLAVQAVVRDEDVKLLARQLSSNQAACFRAACALLDRDALIARLGLPLPALWPPRRGLPPVRFDPAALRALASADDAGAAAADDAAAEADDADADLSYRLARHPPSGAGLLAGLALAAALIATVLPRLAIVVLPVLVALPLLGLWLGPRRRFDECADPRCGRALLRTATRCPGCGLRIAGRVARRADRLPD